MGPSFPSLSFFSSHPPSQDISSFVDQPDVITHVAVVNPKPAVFVDDISSLMVLCTPVSVLLIGLSISPLPGTNRKDIKMYATDMSVSTDVEMSSVVGTPQGRIFMAGSQDGCLYELHYQQLESWFGKRVHLINHSVGAVQSLFPRFSSPKPDGRSSLHSLSSSHLHLPSRPHRLCHLRPQTQLFVLPLCQKRHFSLSSCLGKNSSARTDPRQPVQIRSRKSPCLTSNKPVQFPNHRIACC